MLARAERDTPAGGPDAVIATIVELVESLEQTPDAVGAGIPGVIHDGQALTVPNLSNWVAQVDVGAALEQALGVAVALGNDANLGLLGEWMAGAAHGVDNVLGVWMGTGIGGGLILERASVQRLARRGRRDRPRHRPTGRRALHLRRRGCVEAYAGRRSMTAIATAMVEAGRHTSLFEIRDEVGKQRLTSKVWARALQEADALAEQLFDMAAETLGIGVASLINTLDVELVVIGGGLAEKLGQDLADRIQQAAAPWMLRPNPDLRWVPAALGDDSGVVGAAALARATVLAG